MAWNSTQTVIIDNDIDREVNSELTEFINSVRFIQNLINPDRLYAKDLPKDINGKIIVDITNPHILEDMDFFREASLHYNKFRKYTNLYPNPSPSSSYAKFWKEEARRCREGMIRESDGEWISGPYYFYLNYSPILRSTIIKGSRRAERTSGFPDVYDGDYLFFHYLNKCKEEGKHSVTLKRRGAGFSYKARAILARVLLLGDTSFNKVDVKAFAIASEKEYLIKDGILNKFDDNIDWCAGNTPFPRLKSKDSLNAMVWEMGYTDHEGLAQGTRNSVIGVTTSGDPDKARGKRGPVIIWDEFGKHPNLLKAWMVARESVEEGDFAHGTMIGGETGGTEGADFTGAEEMFYNPDGYNILAVPNVYDKNMDGKVKCAYFFPAYLNRLGCYDSNGNSDVIKALIEILIKRVEIKYNSTDPNTIVQHKAEMCIVPQEAIMRKEGSIFPVSDIKDYIAEISPNLNKFISTHYVGHLKITTGGIISWDNFETHPVLRNYPLKDELDKTGAVEIFEMPHRMADGSIPTWRYIAGIDPIDTDEGVYTLSLGSIFVFDTWTDRIAAEYTGRPTLAAEFYDTCYRLIKFYNAMANYENNIKGLFYHFNTINSLHLLCDTPQVLKDLDQAKGGMFGNRAKGTCTNKMINAFGRKLQADWMLSPAYSVEEEASPLLNLHKIRSLGYLKEALAWNPDGNFDRISAMSMVMILRADRIKYEYNKYADKVKTIFDDPWFQKFGTRPTKIINPAKSLNNKR